MTYTSGKNVWNSSARIHGLPFAKSMKVSSLIPDNPPRLEKLIEEVDEIASLYNSDSEFKEVYDDAIKLQDCVNSLGVHACGICLSDRPLYEDIPLWDNKGAVVTQYEGGDVEAIGIVKLDLLGLKYLDTLKVCKDLVLQNHGVDIDIYKLPMDNKEAYQGLWEGQNLGIFQFEGAGISTFLNRCKPKSIHDLAVITSVYRPGPMNIPGLMGRIAGKIRGDIDDGQFMFPKYTHLFKMAHNELVYQEQFMALSIDMCGFTEIEADKLRKATGRTID